MKMNKKAGIFLLAFAAEWCLLTWFRNEAGYILSPVLLLLANFVMGYYFLQLNKTEYPALKQPAVTMNPWIIFVAGFVLTGIQGLVLVHQNPLLIRNSDVNFLINEIYVKRFVNGEPVYAPYTGFNYGTFTPNYLPFHWLPFCISFVTGFDERYVVLMVMYAAIAYYFKHLRKQQCPAIELYIKAAFPFVIVCSIFIKQGKDFANTVELLLSSYYLILALSLFTKGYLPKIIGLTLTFLSRYILLFWLPVLAWIEFWNDKKKMLLLALGFAASVFIFFILPFVLRQPGMLAGISDLYSKGALGEWDGQDWQQPGDRPFQLFQGNGFASWVYTFGGGTLIEKINLMKVLLFLFSGITSLTLILLRVKMFKQIPARVYSLFSLKISVVVFLSFVVIPYTYLFWTVLFLSMAMVLYIPFSGEEQ